MGVQSQGESDADTVTVTYGGEWYVATDASTGVVSQGETKAEALANLADALELYGRPDPDGVELEESDAPWFS